MVRGAIERGCPAAMTCVVEQDAPIAPPTPPPAAPPIPPPAAKDRNGNNAGDQIRAAQMQQAAMYAQAVPAMQVMEHYQTTQCQPGVAPPPPPPAQPAPQPAVPPPVAAASSNVREGFPGSHIEGYLLKHAVGRSAFGSKNWKKRYFRLHSSGVLTYAEAESGKSLSTIPLGIGTARVACVPNLTHHPESKPDTDIVLLFNENGSERRLIVRAESTADRDRWAANFSRFATPIP